MILLDIKNKALEETLIYKFSTFLEGSKLDKTEIRLADFDGVLYHITNAEGDKTKIIVSINLKYFKELQNYGAEEYLKREYTDLYMYPPEPGYDFSVLLDLKKLCDVNENSDNLNIPSDDTKEKINLAIFKTSTLKRNCLAAVFAKYFYYLDNLSAVDSKSSSQNRSTDKSVADNVDGSCQMNGTLNDEEEVNVKTTSSNVIEPAIIHYREDEAMYIEAKHDRITVIFSTLFQDDDDAIIGKVFLTEFKEGRKASQNAPHVLYSSALEPPKELRDRNDIKMTPNTSYITFVLFPRHTAPQCRENTIDLLCMFRNYLHYHIKCSKAYIHSRMRIKTTEFLKILNRAKPDKSLKSFSKVSCRNANKIMAGKKKSLVSNHFDNLVDERGEHLPQNTFIHNNSTNSLPMTKKLTSNHQPNSFVAQTNSSNFNGDPLADNFTNLNNGPTPNHTILRQQPFINPSSLALGDKLAPQNISSHFQSQNLPVRKNLEEFNKYVSNGCGRGDFNIVVTETNSDNTKYLQNQQGVNFHHQNIQNKNNRNGLTIGDTISDNIKNILKIRP